MELRHLRYFVAAAEELHFARAAERLNIAAPTLTVQIQEIERSLSAQLFLRTKRSVALTPAGEIFLAEARAVLDRFERARSVGRRAGRGEIGRIEIGYVGSAVYSGVLQDQIGRFSRAWPDIAIAAREVVMDVLPSLVEEGELDIGFVRLPMVLPRGLRLHVLARDRFSIALPSSHHAADASGPLPARALAGEGFIAPEQESGTVELARRGRFVPRIAARPGSLLAVLAQVSLGAGVSVIPGIVREVVRLPGVVFRPIAGKPIVSEVAALFRPGEASPAVRHLIRQIRQTGVHEADAA